MFLDIVFVIAGFVMLFGGGEALVRGSVRVAERLGLSQLLIGLVLIGFGTSVPELLVCVKAALNGQPDIALGNVVGSNIANVLLILGVCAIVYPITCAEKTIARDNWMVVGVSAIFVALTFVGVLNFVAGFLLLALLIGYVFMSYRLEKKSGEQVHEHIEETYAGDHTGSLLSGILFTVGGLVILVFGADFLVKGAVNIARAFSVSEAVIGLSLVAIGTSLPELAAGVIAAFRKKTDLIIGNVLGSNLYNILGILGITGLITPVPITGRIAEMDGWIMLGVAVLPLIAILIWKNIGRIYGGILLAGYCAYCATMLG